MQVGSHISEGVLVIDLEGRLDTNHATEAQASIQELLQGDPKKVLFDLHALDYVSSAGLRVILSTAKQLRTSGGALRVAELNDTVSEIFEISGFDTIVETFPSVADAIASFGSSSA